MTKFEKYHPILTDHYTLDWLTNSPLKNSHALLQQLPQLAAQTSDYAHTAQFIQGQMLAIMKNQRLLWGITQRSTGALVGVARILPRQLSTTTTQTGAQASAPTTAQALTASPTATEKTAEVPPALGASLAVWPSTALVPAQQAALFLEITRHLTAFIFVELGGELIDMAASNLTAAQQTSLRTLGYQVTPGGSWQIQRQVKWQA
ncbi:hypothetical protein ACFQHW_03380 [Lapidilactobacillus achengensis]|uniref:Uncharacterized protein n=1 Tax=Lapidilactobacillus achengensis TaxID=2486000 RepID=A0ABW1UKY7_9LACO|nr:hypothetical protein [Lapidilactobacillus achengensis]